MSNIEDEYRRLLRWYPTAWRNANEDVVVSTFLETASDLGLSHPTEEERRSMMLAGLRQRAIGTGERSLVATIALAAGVAFMVFYTGAVSWDPAHSFTGYVGPFTNPSFIVGLLLTIALILSVRRVTAAARMVSLLAIITSVVVGLLAWGFGWLGPSAPAVVLFAAFGVCGLSRSNRISRGLLLAAASVCAVFAALSLEDMVLQSTWALSPWWRQETLLAAVGVLAATVLAWPWRRRTRESKRD
jgi:hypothetical protein